MEVVFKKIKMSHVVLVSLSLHILLQIEMSTAESKNLVEPNESLSAGVNNEFLLNGRMHGLPLVQIISDGEDLLLANDTLLKIPVFSNSTTYHDEKPFFEINVTATYPFSVFYHWTSKAESPLLLQKRYVSDIWDETSFLFQTSWRVYLSYLKLQNSSFEFRSRSAPFFGSSVEWFYDQNDDTINLYHSPDIPNYNADFFDRLRKNKDEVSNCDAYLFWEYRKNPKTGVPDRMYGCSFADGTRGDLFLNFLVINRVPMDSSASKSCIQSCAANSKKCQPSQLETFSTRQWSSYGSCTNETSEGYSKQRVFFPPIYVSLPHGTSPATEMYYKLEDVKLEKMISLDSITEHHKIGSRVTVRCRVSESFAATPFRFALKYKGTMDFKFLPIEDNAVFGSTSWSRSTNYRIDLDRADIERIFCFAPLLGSFGWINASLPIQVTAQGTNENFGGSKWVSASASANTTFFLNGRRHELPTIKVKSEGKTHLVRNGEFLKIPAFSKHKDEDNEEELFDIVVTATYPFYAFYDRGEATNPKLRQKRYAEDIWNETSFEFRFYWSVYLTYLMPKSSTFEFRSNVYPFFGSSVLCSYDKDDNVVNIYNNLHIPSHHAGYFDRLREGKDKADNCDAYLFYHRSINTKTGAPERLYGCSFQDETPGTLVLINLQINKVPIDGTSVVHEDCIESCENNPKCPLNHLSVRPSRQWSIYGYCINGVDERSSSKRVYFPPIYVSLPQGTKRIPDIYYRLKDVRLEKMISLDPMEEFHSIGSSVSFRCNISVAFAGTPFRIALKYNAVQDLKFLPVHEQTIFSKDLTSRSITYNIHLDRMDVERIFCFAPQHGSFGWINASAPIRVTEPMPPLFLHGLNLSGEDIPKMKVDKFSVKKTFALGSTNKALTCYAIGDPAPEITWTWNHVKINESKGGQRRREITWSQLLFSQILKTTEGEYICTASNNQGVVHASFYLVVSDDSGTTSLALSISLPVVALALIVVTAIVIWIKKTKVTAKVLTKQEYQDFIHGSVIQSNSHPHSVVFSKAFQPQFIIDRSRLEFDVKSVLGSGQYGIVMKGRLKTSDNSTIEVAVKTTKPYVDVMYVKALISEVKIMDYLGEHPNVAKFLGACIENLMDGKLLVVVEFCGNGDLLACLRNEKALLLNSISSTNERTSASPNDENNQISYTLSKTLLAKIFQWSRDIANGMAFIGAKNVIHGDLAARNILLDGDNVAKISDFGLSRQLLRDYTVYKKKPAGLLPWKWMAVESLTGLNFSVQSDTWAFGITLWEIFSLGDPPYSGCRYNEEFVKKLSTGFCPSKPMLASDEWYNIMRGCWNVNPELRLSMACILDRITEQQGAVECQEIVVNIDAGEISVSTKVEYTSLD